MNINENQLRVGRFTSSKISKLVKMGRGSATFSAAGQTYIYEKAREKKLGRSLGLNKGSSSTAWGHFLEQRVYDLIGLEYLIESKETKVHPRIDDWAGSPDLVVPDVKISDIKCYELDKGTKYADVLEKRSVELFRSEFPDEYWQIVSNACIFGVQRGEAILYMPYKSELADISQMVLEYEQEEHSDAWKYTFIYQKDWMELAVIPDDSGYSNLTSFEFEIPREDMLFLENRVLEAREERNSSL